MRGKETKIKSKPPEQSSTFIPIKGSVFGTQLSICNRAFMDIPLGSKYASNTCTYLLNKIELKIRELEKSALIWRKNALIVVIYAYNFSFKMNFLRVSRKKTRRFFPCRAFLSRVVDE